ncbi:MAG: hypothetical protein HQL56_07300 [Magnetococcales bacterium]|nr:hypothetical protein [Magnetococcales bacterium]
MSAGRQALWVILSSTADRKLVELINYTYINNPKMVGYIEIDSLKTNQRFDYLFEEDKAKFIILLVTNNLIYTSPQNVDNFNVLLSNYRLSDNSIIPIIIESCSWEHSWIGQYKTFPRNGKSVSDYDNKQEAWLEVAKHIEDFSGYTPPFPKLVEQETGVWGVSRWDEAVWGPEPTLARGKVHRPPKPTLTRQEELTLAFLLVLDSQLKPETLVDPRSSVIQEKLPPKAKSNPSAFLEELKRRYPEVEPSPLWLGWVLAGETVAPSPSKR